MAPADAVPALAALLPNEHLASWARIALEAIPDRAVDAALRDALTTLNGRQAIGVINSIGVRRDADAVDELSNRLTDSNADVASAAAVALGHIGTEPATTALRQALADSPAPVRSAVAEGCILCAEKLLADGKSDEAAQLYDEVRNADVPKPRILEATRGAIIARQAEGIPLMAELLESGDRALFRLGLTTSRELLGGEVTDALVTTLGKTTPERQALLMEAFADRDDIAALPAVLEAAGSGPVAVRVAALEALKRLGNASCVPSLLEIAVEADEQVAEAAKAALEGLPGDDVNADLVARLPKAKGKMRQLVIEAVGLRRIDAVPALLEAANDSDAEVRSAALTALGSTVGLGNLSVLIERVVTPTNTDDQQAAGQALRAACIRLPDQDACAKKLEEAMSRASASVKNNILEILGAMGGTESLRVIGASAKDGTPELQDTASRLLGEWMTVDAASTLLDVAKTPNATYRIRALRGYLRLARQFRMPDKQRAEMCRNALQAATRDDEKTLVMEVLDRYPSVDTLKVAVEAAKDPAVKKQATATAKVIAEQLDGNASEVKKLLSQLGSDQ